MTHTPALLRRTWRHLHGLCSLCAMLWLAGCTSTAPAPGWALNAEAAAQHATAAALQGQLRVAALQWRKARFETARTARADLLAQLELLRCAVHSAALLWDDCPAWKSLAQDATPAQAAYARYLQARPLAQDAAQLTAAQRALARVLPGQAEGEEGVRGAAPENALAAVQAMGTPLARLTGASVALRAGLGSPALLQLGVETASSQGWSRALMAWLLLQERACTQAGDSTCAQAAQRRLALLREAQVPSTSASQPALQR